MSIGKRKNNDEQHPEIQEHLMKEERFLEGLTEEEQKLYHTCKSLLYSISDNGNLEEACDWLEKFIEEKGTETKPHEDASD
ncbi:MAG: hypothetical protein U5R49_27310 [Deltaproteobacteria bacterium]|nr:hypothetical protein [Deltaproteobacteria bacterium]